MEGENQAMAGGGRSSIPDRGIADAKALKQEHASYQSSRGFPKDGAEDAVLPRLVRRGHLARLGGPSGCQKLGQAAGAPHAPQPGSLQNSASPGGDYTARSPQPGEPHRFEYF